MIRKAFIMKVNADAHVEYQRRHNPIWPELETVLKEHGSSLRAIYLDEERTRCSPPLRLSPKNAGMPLPAPTFANVGGSICVT